MARTLRHLAASFLCLIGAPALAGPYTEAGHAPAEMLDWAGEVEAFVRGPLVITQPNGGLATHGQPEDALGLATGLDALDTVSLGDGGSITLYFPNGIENGAGDDFAVFENGFYSVEGLFAELAFVEVSSNGSDFARFPAISLISVPVPAFGAIDPSNVRNLAGKQPIELGTGFDLAELAAHPLVLSQLLDLDDVAFVRVVDVVGNGSRLDSLGHPVYDPYATPFPQSGFDLQGVGVLHAVPEPSTAALLGSGAVLLRELERRRMRRRRNDGRRGAQA